MSASPGKLWSDSDERGVYRTKDAANRGREFCAALRFDRMLDAFDGQTDPETLYAGLWDFRRKGWTFRSGGENETAPSGSGLFKSKDGGETWTQLDEKTRKACRRNLGQSRRNVCAVQTEKRFTRLSKPSRRKTDFIARTTAAKWVALDRSQMMIWRPFYFANLIVDPKNENRIYSRI
jgi:hypothetical protein